MMRFRKDLLMDIAVLSYSLYCANLWWLMVKVVLL